eukprot:scaffold768_cov382-Prasinococcus_capsulatus_cf.AAC.7
MFASTACSCRQENFQCQCYLLELVVLCTKLVAYACQFYRRYYAILLAKPDRQGKDGQIPWKSYLENFSLPPRLNRYRVLPGSDSAIHKVRDHVRSHLYGCPCHTRATLAYSVPEQLSCIYKGRPTSCGTRVALPEPSLGAYHVASASQNVSTGALTAQACAHKGLLLQRQLAVLLTKKHYVVQHYRDSEDSQ